MRPDQGIALGPPTMNNSTNDQSLATPEPARDKKRNTLWRALKAIAITISLSIPVTVVFHIECNRPEKNILLHVQRTRAVLTLMNGDSIELSTYKTATSRIFDNSKVTVGKGYIIYDPQNIKAGNDTHTITTFENTDYSVTLIDGTKIWLKESSSLEFVTSMSGAIRKVILSGEAVFDVSPSINKGKQGNFFVQIKGRQTAVEVQSGHTHFTVHAYPEDEAVTISVIEGNGVKINNREVSAILAPERKAEVYTNSLSVINTKTHKEERFDFLTKDLHSLMDIMSKWYEAEIEYKDDVQNRRFVASINKDADLTVVLRVLEMNGVRSVITNRKIVLMAMK